MNITVFGVDPGVSGAVSVVGVAKGGGFYSAVLDLPVTTHTFLANQSKSLDIPAFADILDDYTPRNHVDAVILVTEQMQSMGFKTPARTLTMLAEMAGNIEAVVRMVCRQRQYPLFIRKYQPKTWTHWMFPESANRNDRKTDAKNESLEKARKLFPSLIGRLNLKKHHDRAEALLLTFTALAELDGCVVDPKLKRTGDLVDTYLLHKQDAKDKPARITDILGNVGIPRCELLDEINKKKNGGR
jgi:hypothetical protein